MYAAPGFRGIEPAPHDGARELALALKAVWPTLERARRWKIALIRW